MAHSNFNLFVAERASVVFKWLKRIFCASRGVGFDGVAHDGDVGDWGVIRCVKGFARQPFSGARC
jgi:hypothetical protein